MHFNPFDPYQARQSPIHRLDPRVKAAFTLAYILSNALLPDGAWLAYLSAWALVLLAVRLAHLSASHVLKRSALALPFTLAAVTVIFTLPGQPLASGNLGAWRWTITDAGLIRFLSILLRSWLSVQMAILLTLTTPFPDILHALRHLRAPRTLVAVMAFMYRYLFVLADEALRLLRARAARSARLEGQQTGPGLAWRARVAGNMAGQLFLRSYARSERVYHAMLARGYKSEFLTLNPHLLGSEDWVIGLSAGALLLVIQILGFVR